MALLYMDGFDGGDVALRWVNGHLTSTSASTRFNSGLAASITNNPFSKDIPPSSQIFVGAAVRISNLDAQVRPYINIAADGGTVGHLSLGYSNSSIILYRGSIGGAVLATYASVFAPNTWYSIEVSATIADAGGTCVVRLNGQTVINFTGDTKNNGTSTLIDRVSLGANGGYTASFDDVYICDSTGAAPYNTFLGDVRVHTLSPSGTGSSTQFTPSSGANYTTVDELPYSATDYVSSGVSGNRDLYAMADLPATAGPIMAVQNTVIARRTDAGLISLKPAIKSGASVYYGSDMSLGGGDQSLIDLRTTDPATGAAWTASGVNSLEAGFEVV